MGKFFATEQGFLSDCLHAVSGQGAREATPDDALRPNQLLAVTLGAIEAPSQRQEIVKSCQALVVPGGIRSLADRPVTRPMPIAHNGALLNDPLRPYWGTYEGDEDTRRKPAYHNGTAWTWLFPSYAEAMVLAFGEASKCSALSILGSSAWIANRGTLGQIPEVLDGDAPHRDRGCSAQAWGVTELYRVITMFVR
jgi:glycogen debranching enzyme